MKTVINVVPAQCILCCFGYILLLMLVKYLCTYFVYFHGCLKKMFIRETAIYSTYKMGEVKQINIKNLVTFTTT